MLLELQRIWGMGKHVNNKLTLKIRKKHPEGKWSENDRGPRNKHTQNANLS